MRVKVKDPSGQTWRVTRRWVPWRRRLKGVLPNMPTGVGSLGDNPISLVIGIIFLIIAIPFILLAIVAALELLLLFLVIPFALLARALFGQHWTVEARRGFHIWYDEPAGDWQASGIRIHALADQIRHGDTPPQTVGDGPG
ncbi:hypothetical protein NSZ01_37650 [Nocardioides szechwanensis]|uniref:Uncharacterized protein n=1 Tax=Nocardioides szechwanensis TaxID=1005944 RepID=A0A1H0LV11_9ACTN|nr:hypothetical protein NSZ01_37650 [Nocardioides szechwanensis]SDO72007.1 hypothetical protein SAMN05192576_0330 [Nocardioides szechwanensis]